MCHAPLCCRLENCLDILIKSDRLPEAAIFARTHLPSHVGRVLLTWKEKMSRTNVKAAQALADPVQYPNLFPGFEQALHAEQFFRQERNQLTPASMYSQIPVNINIVRQDKQLEITKCVPFFQAHAYRNLSSWPCMQVYEIAQSKSHGIIKRLDKSHTMLARV